MQEISVFWVPITAMMIPIVAIVGGIYSQIHNRRLKADQRMALIARGVSLNEIEAFMKVQPEGQFERPVKDPMRSLGNARRAAVILISIGLGLIVFFVALRVILDEKDVLAGAACGLVPLMIGLGFVVDYQLQKREMSRFGLEIETSGR